MKWAGPSPFCTTIMSFAKTKPLPPSTNPKFYHQWMVTYLPKFQTLESQAPNAQVKTALGQMITVMQTQGKASSVAQLKKLVASNRTLWANDFKALLKAVTGCISSLY